MQSKSLALITDPPHLVLTVPEVSKLLGLPNSKVYMMIAEGLIQGSKIGYSWRVRRASVDKYLTDEQKQA